MLAHLPALIALVRNIADRPEVGSFYIGRASDSERRRRAHGAPAFLVVATMSSVATAITVEGALLAACARHPKLRNRVLHSGGGAPRVPGAAVVYLALWPAPAPLRVPCCTK